MDSKEIFLKRNIFKGNIFKIRNIFKGNVKKQIHPEIFFKKRNIFKGNMFKNEIYSKEIF